NGHRKVSAAAPFSDFGPDAFAGRLPFTNDATITRDGHPLALCCQSTFLRAKQNPYLHTQIGVSEFNLDDDLLS
ncbi:MULTISPECIES: hypothetical protein, partial [unclassified Pseudomonas]|uniref:hypothetical protein n=1 Tax=unclassified Pseudomonas TaxID=196821 RepID=UPI001C436BDE